MRPTEARGPSSPPLTNAVLSAAAGGISIEPEDPGGLYLTWLARDFQPRVLVSGPASVLWMNDAAAVQLQLKRDVELRGNSLAMTDPSHQAGLEKFLAICGGELGTWSVPRADGDGHLLFRAQGLSRSPPRCGVTFYGSGTEFTARYADIERIFGLTRAEQGVLLRLLDGFDAQHIAKLDGVSIETTRSHIRSIYLKIDVNSREGLFHRLSPYRI